MNKPGQKLPPETPSQQDDVPAPPDNPSQKPPMYTVHAQPRKRES